ncbi:MAG: 16S rRNA (cytidine(1402)-2'-O)-methyltransferase [Oscillospiraceae bacterium]|nr:16S rRNA (cytidine(1402)-2'-O)-methyltransferase [Oscillospiraceae bacterium]
MNDTGKLYVVGTPIGNLSDFSPRGIETLENSDYIAAEDTRVSLRLLTHFGIKKPMLSYYKPHEAEKSARILELLSEGNTVALVSDAGMPCISDPGVYLVQRCYEAGIPVEVIPSCNAAIAAVAISGIDTMRFAFEGFLPVNKKERSERLSEIKSMPHTLIFYEAPHKLCRILADMRDAFGGERFCALCRELTKLHEEVIRGTLSELCEYYESTEPRGEYVIVVAGAEQTEDVALTIEQAAQLARQLVLGGEKMSDACKKAAKETGFPKQEIYKLLLEDE